MRSWTRSFVSVSQQSAWRDGSATVRKENGTVGSSPRFFFFQAEDGIRDLTVTGVQTCALPILRISIVIVLLFALTAFGASKTLDIYIVDVEGGNATLFVSPSGESLLIDTGNIGAGAPRDAGRIIAAMKDAGVQQIDHLITTHWHGDHFGGMAELASKVTIREFIDHGPNVQPGELADTFLQKTYPPLYAKAKHTVAKPGDKISMAGARVGGGGFAVGEAQ